MSGELSERSGAELQLPKPRFDPGTRFVLPSRLMVSRRVLAPSNARSMRASAASGCGGVGTAPGLGPGDREFEPLHPDECVRAGTATSLPAKQGSPDRVRPD